VISACFVWDYVCWLAVSRITFRYLMVFWFHRLPVPFIRTFTKKAA